MRRRSPVNPILLAAVPASHSCHQIREDYDMETRRCISRRSSPNPILIAAVTAGSHQIQEDFEFDLHDLSADDIQFILNRRGLNCHYNNELHRQISYKIAIHGVKVRTY